MNREVKNLKSKLTNFLNKERPTVLFCVLELGSGSAGVVSGLPAEAQPYTLLYKMNSISIKKITLQNFFYEPSP